MPPRNIFQENYRQLFPWVESSPRNENEAFCTWCKKCIQLSINGKQSLIVHGTRDRRHQMQAPANQN